MRIRELRLIRYGKFTDRALALPASKQDVHLIVGPNEAGKSTIRQAIGDWLFGIPARTPLAFLHPMPELRLGGTLERPAGRASASGQLTIDRTKGNKNTLRTPQDDILPDNTLAPWLANLQREAWDRMYGLDHAQLVAGGADILEASNDIGRMLFQSAAGIEHLSQIQKQIREEADGLWAPRKSGKRLYYQAHDAFMQATRQVRQDTLRAKDWKARHEALQTTRMQLRELRTRHAALAEQTSRLQRIRRVAPLLQALDAARQRHQQLLAQGDIPLLPENARAVLGQAQSQLALAHAEIDRLTQEIDRIQQALTGTPVDQNVLALAADIAELNERRLQFRAHRADIAKREHEVALQWQRVQELAGGLGWTTGSEDGVRQRLPVAALRSRMTQLLKQHTSTNQALNAARNRLDERRQQLKQVQGELDALPQATANPALTQALDDAAPFAQHAANRHQAQQKASALAVRIEAALAAMGTWRKTIDELASMLAPEVAAVQTLQAEQRDAARESEALDTTIAGKQQEIGTARLALKQLVRTFQPISLAQVQEARQARDALWQQIKTAPQHLTERAAPFEGHITHADQLADARLERARHEAERQTAVEQLERQELELAALVSRSQALQARMQQQGSQWLALAQSGGLPPLPLELATTWLQQRQAVLALAQEHADIERQNRADDTAAEAARQALWASLHAAGGTGKKAAPPLAECLHLARTRVKAADQAQGRRETLQQQRTDWQGSLPALENTVKAAQTTWDDWCTRWQAALAAAGYASNASPEEIEAQVDTLQQIQRLLDAIRTTRSERIDAMRADLDALAASAQALAQRIAPQRAKQPADEITLALKDQLENAERARAQQSQLHKQLDQVKSDLKRARNGQLAAESSLAPLQAAAGVTELDALAQAIERSDQLRDITHQIEVAQENLEQSSDGFTEPALREQATAINPDTLTAALAILDHEAADCVSQIEELGRQQGSQKAAFDALDGASSAAEAETRRQEAIATMADAAQRYIGLATALQLLRWSIEKFRQTQQGPMLACASTIFKTLTQGSFDRLLVDADDASQHLICVRESGEQVTIVGMSEGSRDQLYLALRLAALQLQTAEGLTLPFIADDLFINFDDERTLAGLKVLGELSRRLQVIVLTHHEHLVPLAQEALGAGLNVVRLQMPETSAAAAPVPLTT